MSGFLKPLRLTREANLPPTRLGPWPRLLSGLESLARRLGRAPRELPIHAVGRRGEELAYWCLRRQGYTIVARNYRHASREGEIDLIAWQGEGADRTLVFVEVKTRTTAGAWPAEMAVDVDKRKHLTRLARAYRRRRGYRGRYRFDVVVIYHPTSFAAGGGEPPPEIKLHRNAFYD